MIEQSEWWRRVSEKGKNFVWTFISSTEISLRLIDRFTLAAWRGDVSKVVRLLDEGMPIDSVGGFGWTALQCAAMSNQTDVIHEFLERGANVNKQWDCLGLTGLNLSAPNKKTDVIRLLLQCRALTNIKDEKGQKPIDCGRGRNREEVVFLLDY